MKYDLYSSPITKIINIYHNKMKTFRFTITTLIATLALMAQPSSATETVSVYFEQAWNYYICNGINYNGIIRIIK